MGKERESRRVQQAKQRAQMESRRRFLKIAGATTLAVTGGGVALYLVDHF